MKQPFRRLVITWKDLSVLCLLALMWVAPASSDPLDFAHENEQSFSGNSSLEKDASRLFLGLYMSNDFSQIDRSEPLFWNVESVSLADNPAPEKGRKPHFWRDHLMMYGAVWMFTFTVGYKNLGSKFSEEASLRKFGHHFTIPPELKDHDPFVTNYITHPMFGGFTYHVFRKQGHTARQSFFASVLHSTLFEYTVEGFIQRPSGVDLLVTPLIGAPLGAHLGKWILPVSVSYVVLKYLLRSPL